LREARKKGGSTKNEKAQQQHSKTKDLGASMVGIGWPGPIRADE